MLDHENLPYRGEYSPHDAAQLARVIEAVHESDHTAFSAWTLSGDAIIDSDRMPCVSDFDDRYCGIWESFDDYAKQLAEDIALLDNIPEEVARYFNWQAWTQDLAFDYSTCDADHGVFVFRIL